MRHSVFTSPQFYTTPVQPCPYLEGYYERKLFTSLQGHNVDDTHHSLSQQGFRRSQNILYRPACDNCSACQSARVRVADFKMSKSQKRVWKKARHYKRLPLTAWTNEEQYDLFMRYLASRHADGGMADMDMLEYSAMVEQTPVTTRIIEYRDISQSALQSHKSNLHAVCLTDVLRDGVSLVYSFFDAEYSHLSLGSFMILDHIELAREMDLPYVYLGYWVQNSDKMEYKSNFQPIEIFRNGVWQVLTPEMMEHPHYGIKQKPISEQVAEIELPHLTHK